MHHAKKARALLAGLALTIAVAAPAAAATTHDVSDTVVIPSSIAITGAPASITYSGIGAGLWQGSAAVDLEVTTNNLNGAKLSVTGTDLARSGGGASIPATARVFTVSWDGAAPSGALLFDSGMPAAKAAGQSVDLAQSTAAGTWSALVDVDLNVPASLPAGTYSGVLTFAAADR